jgi:voltage-gated potassium channel
LSWWKTADGYVNLRAFFFVTPVRWDRDVINFVRILRSLRHRRAFGAGCTLLLLAIAILGNSLTFYLAERRVDDTLSMEDALWYSVISITTIGYGDFSASTTLGRLGTVFFIVIFGLGTFTVVLGMLIDSTANWIMRSELGMGNVYASGHVLLVHFPAAARVSRLIEELQSDPKYKDREIVIVTDQVERLPFSYPNVLFVQGSSLESDTYHRAKIEDADLALVLARSYTDANSDAVVSSAVSVIDRIKPAIHIVAECVNDRHRELFEAVRCDAIVPGMTIADNLLVQEMYDPGITKMIETITSNLHETTLFCTPVDDAVDDDYGELASRLLRRDVNVLCINRDHEPMMTFGTVRPQAGDTIVYIAKQRHSWSGLLDLCKG